MSSSHINSVLKNTNKLPSNYLDLCSNLKNNPQSHFNFYPFCNERLFNNTIEQLGNLPETKSEKSRIAILVGESNFISLLPEIKKHTDIIIFDDIQKIVHTHNQYLLRCLEQSKSTKDFIALYEKNHPLHKEEWMTDGDYRYMNGSFAQVNLTIPELVDMLKSQLTDSAMDKHFLSSEDRFQECKNAAASLKFAFASYNLTDAKENAELATVINKHNAYISVLNVTNIHDYDNNFTSKLSALIPQENQENTIILFGSGGKTALKSEIVLGLDKYKTTLINETTERKTAVNDEELKSSLNMIGIENFAMLANEYNFEDASAFTEMILNRVYSAIVHNQSTMEKFSQMLESLQTQLIDPDATNQATANSAKVLLQSLSRCSFWKSGSITSELHDSMNAVLQSTNSPSLQSIKKGQPDYPPGYQQD